MNLTQDIAGVATTEDITASITSIWSYTPEDPWVVEVAFPEQEEVWAFSLDLVVEAFTSPPDQLHGSGDLQIEIEGNSAYFHLSNGYSSATLKFASDEIQEFLNQVNLSDTSEAVALELEKFLEEL